MLARSRGRAKRLHAGLRAQRLLDVAVLLQLEPPQIAAHEASMQMKLPHVLALLVLCVVAASAHAAELRLHALLDGASVVSATDSKATGEAKAVLAAKSRT